MNRALLLLFVSAFACAAAQEYFTLFSNYTNEYVVVDPSSDILYADGTSASSAAVFKLGTAGGDGVSIIYVGNGLYVSNDASDGSHPFVANRGSVSTWEGFLILDRSTGILIEVNVDGNVAEVQSDYTIKSTGVNPYDPSNPNNVKPSTLFTIAAPPTVTPIAVSSVTAGTKVILYSVSESKYVVVDRSTSPPSLKATDTNAATAAIFTVVSDPVSGRSNLGLEYMSPLSAVQSSGGGGALVANGNNFGSWEELVFTPVSGATTGTYTITAEINGDWVTVSSGGGSLSPTTAASGTPPTNTQFFITTPAINV